jgi:hypothetical protein
MGGVVKIWGWIDLNIGKIFSQDSKQHEPEKQL